MRFLKRKITEIWRFFNIPPNVERIYTDESAQKNSITMRILAALIVTVELFNICRVLFFTNAKLSTVNNQIYFTLYVTLFLSAIIFTLIDRWLPAQSPARTRLYIATAYFWMLWHVALNRYDLSRTQNGDIAIFSCAVLVLAIFAHIKPRHTLTIATLSYILLLTPFDGSLDSGGYINATISLILACLVALRVYALSINQIYQHIEIDEKSTQLQTERAELKSSLEKYEMVLNNTNDHIFEIDLCTGRLIVAKNSRIAKRLGGEITNVTEWLRTQTIIYPEYTDLLIQGVQELATTKQDGDYTFRIYTPDGSDKWYRLRLFLTHSDDDVPPNGIGIISDIDVQYRQVEQLTSQTRIDPMTGLLNAVAFRNNYELALTTLAEHEHLVMFMIDLDDFKAINDTYGHFAGDCVLKEVARVLITTFRDYDSSARLGGDEFAIIMNHVKDTAIIEKKATKLTQEIAKIAATEHKIHISCSIGIAAVNNKHTHYDEIYQCADKALYESKNCGKGCYRIDI